METQPVDIEAHQIVRWLRDEKRRGAHSVDIRVTRSYETRQTVPPVDDIGGDGAEPLSTVTAVGVLEIAPPPARNGWLLRIRAEDDIGDRLPQDEPVPEGEEIIDIDTFDAEFVAPNRATIYVSVETQDDGAMTRFEALFESMLKNVHAR